MDCRLEIKKRVTESVINKTITGNVFKRLNDNTIKVSYSPNQKFVKNRDQAFEVGLRKVHELNDMYVSTKYGNIASLNYATNQL